MATAAPRQRRTFDIKDAVRTQVPLMLGLIGCSGSGKSFSALRLATGIQSVSGGDIYGIDTEYKRMLYYTKRFKFKHVMFQPPYGSLDYYDVIHQVVEQGAKIVVIDQLSLEHEGEGGYLDRHEQECERLMTQWKTNSREKVQLSAWQKPKAERRKLLQLMISSGCHFICCFRAREKVKPIKGQVVPLGWMPIAGDEIAYEMTLNALLLPGSNGVPTFQTDSAGSNSMIKLPDPFKEHFKAQRPLDEETGAFLAKWAFGETIKPPTIEPARNEAEGSPEFWEAVAKALSFFDGKGVDNRRVFKRLGVIDSTMLLPKHLEEMRSLAKALSAGALDLDQEFPQVPAPQTDSEADKDSDV